MYQLRKINLGSVAIYSFILIFILGLLIMLPFGLINMFIASFAPREFPPPHFIFPFGAGVIFYLFFPVIYAIMGSIFNVILAWIYNLISAPLGGIKFDLEKIGTFTELENQ